MPSHFATIQKAIEYVGDHQAEQPQLDDIARHVGLSPNHLHNVFTEYSGVSPKKFLQALTVENAKQWLDDSRSVIDATYACGLSSTSRLHDHFVTLEAMTPAQFKNKGRGLTLYWGEGSSEYGGVSIAWTDKGIHKLFFSESENDSMPSMLSEKFPNAEIVKATTEASKKIDTLFTATNNQIQLHIQGSPFQIKVWQALLAIPTGSISTYKRIAENINKPSSARAVGNAVGANPIALIIPCHRVIQQSGALGGYRWGESRKRTLLTEERLKRGED